jgi:hypothetical protein
VRMNFITSASTRWASGPDLSTMAEAGLLDATHETFREYERIVGPKLSLATILSGFEINNFVASPKSVSAITLLPCLISCDFGSEPFFAHVAVAAVCCWRTSPYANSSLC